MARKFTKQLTEEWIAEMRADLKPGDKLYTVLRGVSASGMSRHIDVYRLTCENGEVVKHWLSPRVSAICGYTFDEKKECLRVSGCGMDMGADVVYQLSRKLFSEGFNPSPVGIRPLDDKRVNANIGRGSKAGPMTKKEIDDLVSKGWKFTGGRNGDTSGWDNDGGFALRQEWM